MWLESVKKPFNYFSKDSSLPLPSGGAFLLFIDSVCCAAGVRRDPVKKGLKGRTNTPVRDGDGGLLSGLNEGASQPPNAPVTTGVVSSPTEEILICVLRLRFKKLAYAALLVG